MKQHIQNHLKTRAIGKRVFYFDELDSTNLEAFRLINDGKACFGDVIVAKTQSSGKGQQGNSWCSPAGSVYMSIVTASRVSESSNLITFASAVSCVEAIRNVTGFSSQLKWVNDIIINNRKLGGILAESITRGNISTSVVGIGINVNSSIHNAENAKFLPVSLGELVQNQFNTAQLIAEICNSFEINFDIYQKNPELIVQNWKNYSNIIGNKVDFLFNDQTLTGIIKGIDNKGFLVLESNEKEHIISSTRFLTKYY